MLVTGICTSKHDAFRDSDLCPLRIVDYRPREENAFRSLKALFKTLGDLGVIHAVLRVNLFQARNRYVLFFRRFFKSIDLGSMKDISVHDYVFTRARRV